MSFVAERIEAWQSYRQAWAKRGPKWAKAVAMADREIKKIKMREADWRNRVYGILTTPTHSFKDFAKGTAQ